ncbi:transmembrane protein 203-like [Sagmatias obliquidens]|uniref:transmembrane protein 203-like n=1 Tax=Sagmatias obliquidens TaxID=3371155 RepID=UPI000F443CAB|nr:transmembrane protein 203-like [Lagenorhynchus obliquidens]
MNFPINTILGPWAAPGGAWHPSKAVVGWRPVLGTGRGPGDRLHTGAEGRGRRGRFLPLAGRGSDSGRLQRGPWGVAAQPDGWDHRPRSTGAMLFSLRELVQWLGFATFEIFVHLLALLVFSVLLALRVDGLAPGLSWWNVFVPFVAADGLSTYITTIISVRLFQDREKRLAMLRLFWFLTVLSLKFVFEMLLCQKLVEPTRELWFVLITSPVFILLQLLMIRACRVN